MNTFILFLALVLNSTTTATEKNIGAYWHGTIEGYQQYLVTGQLLKMTASWEIMQPERQVYDLAVMDANMAIARQLEMPVMLSVHKTPAWARTSPHKCKLPDQWDDLRRFIQLLVDRYHPEIITVWNEPEMPTETAASLYYCCGCLDPNEYRNLVNYLYTAVAWGDTQMVVGEFVMLQPWINQMFAYPVHADGVSFHHYQHNWDLNPLALELNIGYLRGKTDLPLHLTETALLCNWEKCADSFFRAYQAEWLNIAAGYGVPVYWYNTNAPLKNCAMVSVSQDTLYPVWYRFRTLIQQKFK